MQTDYIEQNGKLYRVTHAGPSAGKPTIEVIENPDKAFQRIDPESESEAYGAALKDVLVGAITRMAEHAKERDSQNAGGGDAAA